MFFACCDGHFWNYIIALLCPLEGTPPSPEGLICRSALWETTANEAQGDHVSQGTLWMASAGMLACIHSMEPHLLGESMEDLPSGH